MRLLHLIIMLGWHVIAVWSTVVSGVVIGRHSTQVQEHSLPLNANLHSVAKTKVIRWKRSFDETIIATAIWIGIFQIVQFYLRKVFKLGSLFEVMSTALWGLLSGYLTSSVIRGLIPSDSVKHRIETLRLNLTQHLDHKPRTPSLVESFNSVVERHLDLVVLIFSFTTVLICCFTYYKFRKIWIQ